MNALKWSDISHPTCVVSRHMASPSDVVKWVLKYFRGTCVTYSGCSDLVCDLNFVGDIDKRRSTSSYVSTYHFEGQVIYGGGVVPKKVHTEENHTNMFINLVLLEKLLQWCVASLGLQKR